MKFVSDFWFGCCNKKIKLKNKISKLFTVNKQKQGGSGKKKNGILVIGDFLKQETRLEKKGKLTIWFTLTNILFLDGTQFAAIRSLLTCHKNYWGGGKMTPVAANCQLQMSGLVIILFHERRGHVSVFKWDKLFYVSELFMSRCYDFHPLFLLELFLVFSSSAINVTFLQGHILSYSGEMCKSSHMISRED